MRSFRLKTNLSSYKGANMNEELIKQLKEERSRLYPYGLPVQPRGCSKTYLYLSHF